MFPDISALEEPNSKLNENDKLLDVKNISDLINNDFAPARDDQLLKDGTGLGNLTEHKRALAADTDLIQRGGGGGHESYMYMYIITSALYLYPSALSHCT